ncbi:MAG: sugar phosphate nucleotidyltransferase, partial [Actinomycetota bacterium]
MRAVVLVGGAGTRLRPLTETIPKPLVPLMGRPQLDHVLDHLERHGVTEVVLSSPYLEETFHAFLAARRGHPAVTWITEREPLGTGGAIVNALPALGDGPFLALNGDNLTDLDLTAMIAFHRAHGAAATIALTRVADARPFGLVPTGEDGRVVEFREKPTDPIPGDVNAGTYVLEPAALAAWRAGEARSIEREIFPDLIGRGDPVYGFLSPAYWLDLGTPAQYLRAHADILDGLVASEPSGRAPRVDPSASVDASARLGRHVVVGAGAAVGADAVVEGSVLLERAAIGAGARVEGSILGPGARVGEGAVVEGSALAPGAHGPRTEAARDATRIRGRMVRRFMGSRDGNTRGSPGGGGQA